MSDVEEPSQYIIYGANGWLGRSALKSIIDNSSNFDSSKVLLMFSGNFYMNGANTLARGRFTRGGTTILDYNGFQFNATGSGDEFAWNPYCTYLDSPATTSSTTYAFQFNRQVADSGSVIFNYQAGGLTQLGIFIAMEIGA